MLVAQDVRLLTADNAFVILSADGAFVITATALVDIPVEVPDTSYLGYTTFGELSLQVLKAAFPSMLAETHAPLYDLTLLAGLVKAQKFIDCLRRIQISFYAKSQFYEQCGIATVQAPRGKLNVVYAFKPDSECTKWFYRPVTPAFLTCWSKENRCAWTDVPRGTDQNSYSLGSDNCITSEDLYGTENDQCYKIADKIYARGQNGEIYLAPRPPCGYVVAVHWEGLRRAWASTDAILNDSDLTAWLVAYVRGEITLRGDKDRQLARAMKALAESKFADLMYWCNEERRLQLELDCGSGIDTGSLTQMFSPIYPYDCPEPEEPEEPDPEDPDPEDPDPEEPDTDNLVLWLKADSYDLADGALIGADGLRWINQAPAYAGSDMGMQIEAKQPSFRTGVISTMPAVQFDDSVGKWMFITPGFSDAGATFNGGWTLMVVLKQSAASPGITPGPFFANSAAALVSPHFFLTSAGVLRFKFGVTAILSSANYDAPTPIASPYDTLHFLTVTWKPADGKFYFRNNKTDLGSADLDYSILEPYTIGLGCTDIGIGSFRDGGTWYSSWYNGFLCEMLLYKVPIEAVTLDTLYDDYFKLRWTDLP